MAIPYSRTAVAGIPWYSLLIVLGILAAVALAQREERRLSLPRDTAVDLTLVAVPCGIVGARLYYVLMKWELFRENPVSILYVWEGGIAIYGAVLGGALGVLCYAKKKKLPYWRLIDILTPGLLLAQAIGRWGNYFNMEAYGPEIRNALFQFFPAGVLIPGPSGYVWHMATFFYESLWNLCGFAALWALRKREKEPGGLFCWYLLLYGSGRYLIEQLREDSLYIGSIRTSQMVGLLSCITALAVLLFRATRTKKALRPACFLGAAAFVARWFCLESGWLYAAALAVGLACCAVLARKERKPGAWWLLLPALLDAAGLCLFLWNIPSFAPGIHRLLCSLTLPLLTGWMILRLQANDTKEG